MSFKRKDTFDVNILNMKRTKKHVQYKIKKNDSISFKIDKSSHFFISHTSFNNLSKINLYTFRIYSLKI